MVRERKVVMGQRGMIRVYCGMGKGKTKRGVRIDDPGSRAGEEDPVCPLFEKR